MVTPEVIKVFSGLWWFGIIASIIISILIIQLAIRIPPDRRDMLMTFIGISLLLQELFRHYHLIERGPVSYTHLTLPTSSPV